MNLIKAAICILLLYVAGVLIAIAWFPTALLTFYYLAWMMRHEKE